MLPSVEKFLKQTILEKDSWLLLAYQSVSIWCPEQSFLVTVYLSCKYFFLHFIKMLFYWNYIYNHGEVNG